MKFAKLFAALGGCLLLVTLLVLPQVMEAARARWAAQPVQGQGKNVRVVASEHNDTSPPLREMPQHPVKFKEKKEANKNPKVIPHRTYDRADPVVQTSEIRSGCAYCGNARHNA